MVHLLTCLLCVIIASSEETTTASVKVSTKAPSTQKSTTTDDYGCYSDNSSNRILTGAEHLLNKNNSKESCATFCTLGGFKYAGVEFADECFCGNEIHFLKNKILNELCSDMHCSGNSADFCGGSKKIWIYLTGGEGCYTNKDSERVLTDAEYLKNNNHNTKESCANLCILAGYKYAGVKHGEQCFCGNQIHLRKNKIHDALCNDVKCTGNSADFCGGSNKIWVYLSDGHGCYTNKDSDLVLATALNLTNKYNTKESCAHSCTLGGYKYAGVQHGERCYCGNEIRLRKNKIPNELCNEIKCSGNSSDFCGGSNKIWVYLTDGLGCYSNNLPGQVLTGAVYVNSNNNSKEKCATFCSHGGYEYTGVEHGEHCYCGNEINFRRNKIPDEVCKDIKCSGNSEDFCGGKNKIWIYSSDGHGCYSDNATNRILISNEYFTNDRNTREMCGSICKNGGYKYAGVEHGDQCYCGNEIRFRKNKIQDRLCDEIKCSANSADFCGGSNKIWIYSSAGYGCYSDNINGRVLADRKQLTKEANTRQNCKNICKTNGYKYAGVEYGEQCFCGNEILLRKNKIPNVLCNEMKCSGNLAEFCGGFNKIWVYSSVD